MAQLSTPDISFSLKNVILQIGKAINCHHNVKSRLIDLATQFAPYDYFHFYIDGSVKQIGSQYCKSGFGWIQVSHSAPQCTFHGSTVFFPSSYKSEAMGILTALLTLPYNSTGTISTDSANCIQSSNVPKAHEFTHAQPTSRTQTKQFSDLEPNILAYLPSKYCIGSEKS